MPTVSDHLEEFTEALKKDIPIQCDPTGNWSHERTCQKITRQLSLHYYDKDHLITIGKVFCLTLDSLEKTPVLFKNDMKITQPQYKKFLSYFNAYNAVETKLQQSQHQKVKEELNLIKQRMIALKYRIEAIHGGLDKKMTIDEQVMNHACHLASYWKSKQKLYPKKDQNLTFRDLQKLHDVCFYPEFVRLLFSDKSLQNNFFNWAIRDNNGVDQFVEFPATCSRLRACLLDKRIGRLAPHELDIVKQKLTRDSDYKKILCLPFFDGHEIQRINILDESKIITLNGDRYLSIEEILDIFSKKKYTPGNVEFFGTTGIMNWGNYELGCWNTETESYNRIDLKKPEWWKQLPILEELSKEEIEKKYQLSLKHGEWVRCINSTREALDHDLLKRHGYLEVAIPQENGRYAIYPFGKFPRHFHTSPLRQLRLLAQTVEGRIEYPDENTFYSHRQHATHPKIKTPDQGIKMMERIKNDLNKSIQGDLSFQMGGENCAHWAEETIACEEGKDAPNPFKMPVTKMQPTHEALNRLIKAPASTQSKVMSTFRFFAYIDGRTVNEDGKRVYKTTSFAKKADEIHQYQPAHLNDQIEQGKLPGIITYGN